MEIQLLVTLAIVLMFSTIFSLISSISAQDSTRTTTNEEYCYDSLRVICNNYTDSDVTDRGCEPQTITSILTFPKFYTIGFFNEFYNDFLTTATFTSFSLCYSEGLELTVNHLMYGQTCLVKVAGISNSIKVECNENFPVKLNNIMIILFELNELATGSPVCSNMMQYRFAIIDTSGKLNH